MLDSILKFLGSTKVGPCQAKTMGNITNRKRFHWHVYVQCFLLDMQNKHSLGFVLSYSRYKPSLMSEWIFPLLSVCTLGCSVQGLPSSTWGSGYWRQRWYGGCCNFCCHQGNCQVVEDWWNMLSGGLTVFYISW